MRLKLIIVLSLLLMVVPLAAHAQKETVIKPGADGKATITATSADSEKSAKVPGNFLEIQNERLIETDNLAKLKGFPPFEKEDVLFTDAPSDDGKKIYLLWKFNPGPHTKDVNYIIAWSPNGTDWSPRSQMIEVPCDPNQATRLIDFWEKAQPKECKLGRFERYGKYKDFFFVEFSDFDFFWRSDPSWGDILSSSSFGLKNRIVKDIVDSINKTNPTLSKDVINERLKIDSNIINLQKSIDESFNQIIPWGPNEGQLLMGIIKFYEQFFQNTDYYANLFAISSLNLKNNVPKTIDPNDNLIVAIKEKYNATRVKIKRYKISATNLKPEDKIQYDRIDDFHVKLGVVNNGDLNENSILWLKDNLEVRPVANFINWNKANAIIISIIIAIVIMYNVMLARRNPHLFIRRINGLEAVEEAIGRATEMGKPIVYLTGAQTLSSLSTLAAIGILGKIASKVADYECDLLLPHRDPIALTVTQEVVREAYLNAGRIDAYKEDNIFFLTDDQFAYTAGVNGIMMRERPAANFFMGYYYAEALLLSETGAATGAIQIAGSDALNQLPFFITTCDYTLIGEELYAASAYLSREALMLGSLRGQDQLKLVIMIIVILGCLLPTIGAILADKMNSPEIGAYLDILRVIFYQF